MRLDWNDLEDAFVFANPENRAFLVAATGEILWMVDGMDSKEGAELEERLDGEPFFEIEPPHSSEKWRWMADFTETVANAQLRELLEIAMAAKGAFSRFKDVLHCAPAEKQRWFVYESGQLRSAIERWVAGLGVDVENCPPWGLAEDEGRPVITESR